MNILIELTSAAPATDAGVLDLNALVGGGAGATLVGIIFYVGKLILDRAVPSRSDSRANISILLEGLQSMVKVLQDEKAADAERLASRQARIEALEEDSYLNYTRKAEMQADIIELRARVAQKDRHIKELVHLLSQFGATITGLDGDTLDITLPSEEVKKAVAESNNTVN